MTSSFLPDATEGWIAAPAEIPFMTHVGPLWHRAMDGGSEYGFMPCAEIHGNRFGRLHGGMIAAFADYALGHACWQEGGADAAHVTVHLGLDFVSAGEPGVWTTCLVQTVRRTRSLVFMRGEISAGGNLLATASGIWKPVRQPVESEQGA